MSRKIIAPILMAIVAMTTTGCSNIKFIEKIEQNETEIKLELGNMDESAFSDEQIKEEAEEEAEEEQEATESRSEIKTINNIKFEMKDSTSQVYLNADTYVFNTPGSTEEDGELFLMGEPVELLGISIDMKWAMVRHFDGPIIYIEMDYISYSYVRPETTVVVPDSSDDTQEEADNSASEDTSSGSTSSGSTSSGSTSSGSTSQTIPYPSNPTSTSINLGVTFADVDMVLTVIANGVTANSGPGAATSSTGYEVRSTLNGGNTVSCTGIGENGYFRVDLGGGLIGFIDGAYLVKM